MWGGRRCDARHYRWDVGSPISQIRSIRFNVSFASRAYITAGQREKNGEDSLYLFRLLLPPLLSAVLVLLIYVTCPILYLAGASSLCASRIAHTILPSIYLHPRRICTISTRKMWSRNKRGEPGGGCPRTLRSSSRPHMLLPHFSFPFIFRRDKCIYICKG